MSASLFLIY